MEHYPTEEEEFELMYNEELQLIDDLDDVNVINTEPQPCTSKGLHKNLASQSTLQSPQLSQISHDGSYHPVNRRLFGTPGGHNRISSTPFNKEIRNVEQVELSNALQEIQNVGLNRKRRLEDLFGDIRDIEDDFYVDHEAKKLKSEEERDLEMIAKILQARKQNQEAVNPLKKDVVDRLNALHAFKRRNLSYEVPNWPFIPLCRSDDERIYVRFHSVDYETQHINQIKVFEKGYSGLLGDAKESVWNTAREITVKRLTYQAPQAQPDVMEVSEDVKTTGETLWVDKYKPKKYIDLLSDESTNRTLLYWLKMWDKVVFGREFKSQEPKNGQLNTFNKKTGKFESTGGWNRKFKKALNTEKDEHGRPIQKVALLCGPPGLGKTTLAHTIARHAGYNVRELNASDDRSPEAFRLALENGTQMTSVLNENNRPNCIILDEIDGAPNQSIDFLIKFVTDNIVTKPKKGGKTHKQILKRPIICICNDMYVPALRQLRQVAFVVNFPPIESSRLAERLLEISRKEHMKTDLGALLALAEKSGNDVRSCISMMQFFNAMKKRLAIQDVLNSSLGKKDMHRGLFGVWSAIFQIQRPKREVTDGQGNLEMVTVTDMSLSSRVKSILEIVHMGGDYERLMQGVHENYLSQKMPDPNLNGVVEAMQWFCFSDELFRVINHLQNYSVYPYLQYGFVIWHLLFAGLAWPKINFPNKGYEMNQKATTQKMVFQALRRGVSSGIIGIGQGRIVLLETVPILKRILSPNLRSVSLQLLTPKERYDLKHAVEVMADFGLCFTQLKSADGTYQYQMEPDLDLLCNFQGFPGITLSYFGRQLIAREVELEQMRRVAPKFSGQVVTNNPKKIFKKAPQIPQTSLPNHLQTLRPKRIQNSNIKETTSKDFFGRMVTKQTSLPIQEGGTDLIVKSPIWYRYKEGFNNAVKKDVLMSDIL